MLFEDVVYFLNEEVSEILKLKQTFSLSFQPWKRQTVCYLENRVKRAVVKWIDPQKKQKTQNINSVFNTHLSASLDSIAVQVLTAQSNHQVSIQQFVQHEFL